MITYELLNPEFAEPCIKMTEEDGTIRFVPINPANSDYQAYLAWLENPQGQQSTPNLPA